MAKNMKKAYGKERKKDFSFNIQKNDWSIDWKWSSWSSSTQKLLIMYISMCVYGNAYINDTWQMVTQYHRSHKSLPLSVAPKYVSRFCELSKHEGFLSLQKLLNWNKRHKQRWTNGSNQKNRDIWDSEKEKNAKTQNRKQRKQMEKSTNWSRAPTAQPSFSGPACSLSFPAIGNKTKITPRIDTKPSVYQFHLNWPIPRRQNVSKAAWMKLVQRSGNPPKVFRLL